VAPLSPTHAMLLPVAPGFSAWYCSVANPTRALPPTSTLILKTSLTGRGRECLKWASPPLPCGRPSVISPLLLCLHPPGSRSDILRGAEEKYSVQRLRPHSEHPTSGTMLFTLQIETTKGASQQRASSTSSNRAPRRNAAPRKVYLLSKVETGCERLILAPSLAPRAHDARQSQGGS
jgi:hypothetical protein